MSTYGQFCPVALGAEIFAERWTPLILRELLAGGRRFSDIQHGVPRMSRNLLAQRLVSLQRSGIIDRHAPSNGKGPEYHLTEAGRELRGVVDALGTWGYKWATKDLTDEHLDPDFVMWALRRYVRVDALPDGRVVVLVSFRGDVKHPYWLVLQRPDVDLCYIDPGFDVDVEMRAELEAMARVCLGQLSLVQAIKTGRVELSGAPRHRRGLCNWIGYSHFATAAHG
jgi:DNA-binding HxlR family transcriptional regulator